MSIFATEFQVKSSISKAKFAAASLAWVRGIKRSTILSEHDAKEIHDDDIWLEATNGETLAIKSFEDGFTSSYGVRLEIPDDAGRRWRTECVYSQFSNSAFLRVRGQCVAINPEAQIVTPLKPHFITQSIEEGWAEPDGLLEPIENPHFLGADDVDIAAAIIGGTGTKFLPSIYVSRNNDNSLPFNVQRLAKKMAGLAHIVVETDRGFSFSLMEASNRRNPYGGAVGIFAPNGEQISRLFRKFDDSKGENLALSCASVVNSFNSSLAAKKGWEWQQLQEAQARNLRAQLVSNSSDVLEEYIETFDAELASKNEQIQNLNIRLDLEKAKNNNSDFSTSELLPDGLSNAIGPELYSGEFSDRLRLFISKGLSTQNDQIDERTKLFAHKFLNVTEYTGRATALSSQIKTACKDGNQILKQLGPMLTGFGYAKSQDGKHPKFTPPKELFGLPSETFPSTPSDSQRGGRNRASDIIKSMNLSELKDK